jgi:hypothetical protein
MAFQFFYQSMYGMITIHTIGYKEPIKRENKMTLTMIGFFGSGVPQKKMKLFLG